MIEISDQRRDWPKWSVLKLALSIFLLPLLVSCDQPQSTYSPRYGAEPTQKKNAYVIGVHPLHNPQRLHEIFGPLASLLTDNIEGASFKIEASRNYAAFDEKLYAEKFEFALPNPYQTVQSLRHHYTVFGKMGDDENFRGIILVRKDSRIDDTADLKGETVCFPAETALAATMMPQYYLQTHGLDVNRDIAINYVGSQESSIMNVFLGNAAAGGTWPPPWKALAKERPQLLEEMDVKWQTEPLPNNGLVVRNDVPPPYHVPGRGHSVQPA
jgi:phosphonate transport system substrate-binding protein